MKKKLFQNVKMVQLKRMFSISEDSSFHDDFWALDLAITITWTHVEGKLDGGFDKLDRFENK